MSALLQQELQQTARYFNRKEFNQVIPLCKRILSASPLSSEAHQWLIQSYIRTNQWNNAETALRAAERLFPSAIWPIQLKAMLFQHRGDVPAEMSQLAVLLSAQPDNLGMLNRYIKLAIQKADWEKAQASLQQYGNYAAKNDINFLKLKVFYYRQRGWLDRALEESSALMRLISTNVSIAHEHAVLLRLNGKASEAITLLRRILSTTEHFAVHQNLANAYSDIGALSEAAEHYEKAIRLNPDYIDAYVNLSLILWEMGEKQRYLTHFEKDDVLRSPTKRCAYINVLLNAKAYDKAITSLNEAPEVKNQISGQLLYAKALRGLGLFTESYCALRQIVEKDNSNEVLIETCISAIEAGELKAAENAVEKVLDREPDNQLAKAYWHAVKKSAGQDGYPIDKYTGKYDIFPHWNAAEKASYLSALTAHLASLHSAIEQPINQTLENGTQTRGHLLTSENPLIKTLKAAIDNVVLQFMETQGLDRDRLTDGSGCPHYKGSWSVRLDGEGYHHNHIHSHGRISGVVYLALPRVAADKTKREGWLALGQPFRYEEENMSPDVFVEPALLHCVLFRSFVWHGTIPFREKTQRMTVAFDVGEYGQ